MSNFTGIGAELKKLWPSQLLKDGVVSPRLLWLGVIGVLLIVGSELYYTEPTKQPPALPGEASTAPAVTGRNYEEALEAKLSNLLAQVRGAGAVAVSVTLESGMSQEHARNVVVETKTTQEKDTNGGTRIITESKESSQILVSKEGGVDRPVMVREIKPVIKGILVIAEGASDSTVKANLTRAAEAALGLPAHKVLVLPQRK